MATNGEVILRMFEEVVDRGNLDALDELFDPSFVTHTPQGSMGREEFREFVRAWRTGFPDIRSDVSLILEAGDRVAWQVRSSGTHLGEFMGIPATGKRVDFLSLNQGVIREGKGIEHWVVMDMLTLLSQIGAVSLPGMAAAGA
jgi:predicted ester cyclase